MRYRDDDISYSLKDRLILYSVFFFLVVVLLAAAFGCASRQSSSTDRHRQFPQVVCSLVKMNGTIHEICCEEEHCVFEY